MNKIYSNSFSMRASDFDCFGKIKPSSILDLFQEVAGAHAEELGVGFEDLLKRNILWVLVKVKFEIISEIKKHQTVVVKTWPLPAGRVTLQREYLIEDGEGNVLAKGTSDWVTMDLETRRLSPCGEIHLLKEFCLDRNFEEKLRKVPDFEITGAEHAQIKPQYCDIDENMHLNNIRYSDFVLNLVKPEREEVIDTLQIDFHREIMPDACIDLYAISDEKGIIAKGVSDEGEKMFSCAISYK